MFCWQAGALIGFAGPGVMVGGVRLRLSAMTTGTCPVTTEESDELVLQSFELTSNPGMILALAPDQPIVRVNSALERLLGLRRQELVGRPCREALGMEDEGASIDFAVRGETTLRCTGGRAESFWCQLDVRPMPDATGAISHSYCTLHDVSDYVKLRDSREYLAGHDPLTGLVRSYVFEERLKTELLHAVQACSRVLVCHVEVDRIGVVNELCNFKVGDQLLRLIAERLAGAVGDPELLARIGSNKFVVAFVDEAGDADQLEAGQRVAAVLEPPFNVGGLSLRMTTSIGVACFPDSGSEAQELMQQAASVSRAAKRAGGNEVRVFVPAQRATLNTRLQLGSRMRGAVERGEMELHYQPIVSAIKREVTGMEALVRWRNPELGLVGPDQFIQLAEDLGMIAEIGRWVLHEACMQARRWLDQGVGDFVMSVNVSALQMRGQQLLEDVSRALNDARLPGRCLDLELTETAACTNLEQTIELMREVGKLGVKWSLDDFGVGRSSLSYLQRLPVSRLKIDQSFVMAMPDDVRATRICRAVIGLAHEFGFSVVAEGAEKAVQLAFLERNGCDMVQGFYLSPPVTADAMLAVLREPVLRPPDADADGDRGQGTVLLVDDETNVLRALARLLRRDGYRVVTAATFAEAFEQLASESVEVVVSDHRMPDGKGTEFLGRVKATHPDTVRLILSGYADIGTVTEAINVGAVHRFMTKPWDDDELRAVVRDAMHLARAADHEPGQ